MDEDECVGCNLCWLVCPVDGCITMDRVDTGRPFESWEQRMSETMSISDPQRHRGHGAETTFPADILIDGERLKKCALAFP